MSSSNTLENVSLSSYQYVTYDVCHSTAISSNLVDGNTIHKNKVLTGFLAIYHNMDNVKGNNNDITANFAKNFLHFIEHMDVYLNINN
ncbi:MAG TPA: hypothetical protein VJ729_03175 [Nitrososphaeraceae archaeon]|nr:hypothetical protein [Nitrososphaeraceae archaeon]